jgi:predicted N-acetyltransferase YhbS
MLAYRSDIAIAKKRLFDTPYHGNHYYLGLLATHPDYQCRGFGKELVHRGLDKAKQQEWNVTLFSSPMGRRVYSKLGFRDVGGFRTQIDGEEEYLHTPGMVLEVGGW